MVRRSSGSLSFVAALVVFAVGALVDVRPAVAFGDCYPVLSDQIGRYDALVLCRIVDGAKAKPVDDDGRYLCETIEIVAGFETLKKLPGVNVGYRFDVRVNADKPDGAVYFSFGYVSFGVLKWERAVPVNKREQEYLRALGTSYENGGERVEALLPFLDATEPLIKCDLDVELVAKIPFNDVRTAQAALPVDKLRAWIKDLDAKKDRDRIFTCLRLLSACGSKHDLPMLESRIFGNADPTRELNAGVGCYLMLGGEPAFTAVEKAFFRPQDGKINMSRDAYMAFFGVVFAAKEGPAISRERLLAFYRPLLDLSRFSDQVVSELGRLDDWDSTDKIIKISRSGIEDEGEYRLGGHVWNFLSRSPRPEAKARLEELEKLDLRLTILRGKATPKSK